MPTLRVTIELDNDHETPDYRKEALSIVEELQANKVNVIGAALNPGGEDLLQAIRQREADEAQREAEEAAQREADDAAAKAAAKTVTPPPAQ